MRSWVSETRTELGAGWQLAIASSGNILVAVAGVATLEVVAALLRMVPSLTAAPFLNPPGGELAESVSALIGSAVAVGATLLGLYYTTVGVIASTIYKSVPGDVRDLFIRERNNETYLRVVILTISGGIASLIATALGRTVSGLTLLALGILTALTCVGLVVVTRRLLDYFDPSKLALPLMRELAQAVRIAATRKTRGLTLRQSEAHLSAYRALASYRHLAELLDDKELRNATAPVVLSRQLIEVLKFYSSWKYAIPTESNWWSRVPRHLNWLTPEHGRLELAVSSSVGFPPELQPDYLWFENAIARILNKSLKVAFQSQGGADALAVSEDVAELVAQLTARLQIDEATTIATMWDRVTMAVTSTADVADADAAEYEVRLNQMAAAESLVRPVTMMLLGLSRAASSLSSRNLPAEFDAAIRDPDGLYRGTLPTDTRQMLEHFATAIRREIASEGQRVTPSWWIDHLAARSMAEALLQTEAGVIDHVQAHALAQVTQLDTAGRADLAAVAGMAALELLHKIEFHEPIVRSAEQKLETYRNQNTSIDRWPVHASTFDAADQHRSLLKRLAELLPELRKDEFDPREPDLYGQLYQFVVDGAFKAILDGDRERGLGMYGSALLEMDFARLRVMADLKEQEDQTRLLYALEPVITAMDLAGYALLMHEMDGSGIWAEVKASWDALLSGLPDLAAFLLTAASFVDNTFAMTVGGIERSRRSIALGRIFEDRELSREERGDWDDEPARPHQSPIVSALAPRGYGVQDDLYALFIAEYLVHFLPAGTDLGHKARLIAEQIEWYRDEEPNPGSGEGGDPDHAG